MRDNLNHLQKITSRKVNLCVLSLHNVLRHDTIVLLIFSCSGARPVTGTVKAVIACNICELSANEPKH